ncbi:hypothetical protein [Formosa sp. PL04]|uniref:hypothetical protein n=1 Tax=Formosa sp. PL04 TaxID=3081755 RepID=UPI00298127B9|nr:hypothetical protein [Formosa sp. PL04]MDW5290743.1 hypothetical protein [Formosa sp. PL04]
MKIKSRIKSRLRAFSTLKCKQPIVIFQSDDWGMVRAPENKDFISNFGEPKIWAYDQLESEEELELIFQMLLKYKDANDNPPLIEANFIVSNPDFEATKENGYQSIVLKSISQYSELNKKWNEGVKRRIFIPQYHGRLHFNYDKMLDMIQNDPESKAIFDLQLHGGVNNYNKGNWTLHSEYQRWEDGTELPYNQLLQWIEVGISDFFNVFGYYPKSTIAPQYVFTPTTARAFAELGFQSIQGTNMQAYKKNNLKRLKNIPTGSTYYKGLIASSRNIKFEPSRGNTDWKYESVIKKCVNLINKKIPVIIDSHRINYVGKFGEEGREDLDKLIGDLIKRGCRFLTSEEFSEAVINNGHYSEFGTGKKRKIEFINNSKIIQLLRNRLN